MNFLYPRMLGLLAVVVPILTFFLVWNWRKKQRLIAQFVQSRLLAQLTVGVSKPLQKVRMALVVIAVAMLFFALARPRWGFAWEEATQRGRDIVVAIDTSRSMLAEDVVPNRLARAKLATLDLLKLAKSDRLGLVAFAGSAFLQAPLTLDDEAFRQSVNVLDVGIIPQGGSALSEAIDAALGAFKKDADNHKVLILFSDGEDHESGAVQAAEKAAKAGLRIFTVGVGTPNGELIRVRDSSGKMAFVKDEQGNAVKSSLNEKLLQQIATAADGFYLPLRGPDTMDILYQRGLAPLPTTESSTKMIRQFKERFQWPLGLAILCLIVETFLPDRKRVPRPKRPLKTVAVPVMDGIPVLTSDKSQPVKTVAAALAALLAALSVDASVARAQRDYKQGHYKDARKEYERLLEKNPTDPRLHYNAGLAAYQARDFEKATQEFTAAMAARDLDLQGRASYNLGNSLYRSGEAVSEPAGKISSWEQAVKQFETAVRLNPKDPDAKFNLDLVKKRLEELKQQQQQQNKDGKDGKDDDKKDQDKDKSEKKDQDKKDQKGSQDQQDQKKSEDSQKQDQKQKEQEQQQQQQAEQKQDDKKGQEQKQAQADKDKKDEKDGKQAGEHEKDQAAAEEEAQAAQVGRMTLQQAKQLLEAQKGEEKAFLIKPLPKKTPPNHFLKDW